MPRQPLWHGDYTPPRPSGRSKRKGFGTASLPFMTFDKTTFEPNAPFFMCEGCNTGFLLSFLSQHPILLRERYQTDPTFTLPTDHILTPDWFTNTSLTDDPSRTICKRCTGEYKLK